MDSHDAKLVDRYWSRVVNPESETPTAHCWEWRGYHNADGYSVYTYQGRTIRVHRFAYELMFGPIPEGMVIDHLCRNRWCVNPYHGEAVTIGENVKRGDGIAAANAAKTHCIRGHEFTPGNTQINAKGGRSCRECKRHYDRCRRERNKSSLPADDEKAA